MWDDFRKARVFGFGALFALFPTLFFALGVGKEQLLIIPSGIFMLIACYCFYRYFDQTCPKCHEPFYAWYDVYTRSGMFRKYCQNCEVRKYEE